MSPITKQFITYFFISLGLTCIGLLLLSFFVTNPGLLTFLVCFVSVILSLQGLFTLIWMLHAWDDPANSHANRSPREFIPPSYSFTALLPARHEEAVIRETIRAVAQINYPRHLTEILVLCRRDDAETIHEAEKAIQELQQDNIRLIVFDGDPINKPHSLNIGLSSAKNEIVTIFDAEDQPHPDIYSIVNTVMVRQRADVVQSGVQLMNYASYWFSALNVMEYYFWFKSGLDYFTRIGRFTPLGGNTVFFKRTFLHQVGGWDETCLTEDADIGIRLLAAGAVIRVIYDELHATREETPHSLTSFIKQRTRWDQGFLQILGKNRIGKLPGIRQKILSAYILISPEIQVALLLYTPIGLFIAFTQKLPILASMLSFLPTYLLFIQMLVTVVGLFEFTRSYHRPFYWWLPIKVIAVYLPYQFMLTFSSFRAIAHYFRGMNMWEKTAHFNTHREFSLPVSYAPSTV